MTKRILSTIGLGVLWITGPWWLVMPCAVAHIVYFRGVEIIALALLVDVFYANTQSIPYYTFLSIVGLVLGEWVRRSFLIYNS